MEIQNLDGRLQASPEVRFAPSTASNPATTQSVRPQRPRMLAAQACKADDISLISQAISLASSPNSRQSVQEVFADAVRLSIRRKATKVLTYILTTGAEVPAYSDLSVEDPSTEILEILLAHGWDINARRRIGDRPFLWQVVGDSNLLTWCLEHGATVVPKDLQLTSDDERLQDQFNCPPILESAASQSTVTSFELLRSLGAPFGPRMLHFAARAAVKSDPNRTEELSDAGKSEINRAGLHSERMAMVVHLVDTLGIDPNALDQPAGWMLGNHWGTPLCYVAYSNPNWDCSEVVQFLLQRGADPGLVMDPAGWNAIELAKRSRNEQFLETAENWRARQSAIQQHSEPDSF